MQKRILIIRQDRIGDVVLATALPREIKKRWPDSHVSMLVRGITKIIFSNNPHVDNIITDDVTEETRKESFWPMVKQLRGHHFTHALMLLPEARINYMVFCAGIPVRVGHGIILFHALTFARPVMTRKFSKGRHEGEYSMDLARSIGVKTANVDPEIHLTDEELLQSKLKAAQWGSDKKLIGLHTTSGKSAPNWAPSDWVELAQILGANDNVQVIITDNFVPEELQDLPGVLYPNVGFGLREAMVDIKTLNLLVSASTGPMHIAAALKTPTLSLFCPLESCEPALWGALGNEAQYAIPEEVYCRDQCPGDPHICQFAGSLLVGPKEVARRILS